jgi:hypothetical protein
MEIPCYDLDSQLVTHFARKLSFVYIHSFRRHFTAMKTNFLVLIVYRVYQKFCDISYFAYISTSENG